MDGEEMRTEREGLRTAFTLFDSLSAHFRLWRFEDAASPLNPGDYYERGIDAATAVVIVVAKTLRPAVVSEYEYAVRKNKHVFLFSRDPEPQRNPKLNEFEARVRSRPAVTAKYKDLQDLTSKVQRSLFDFFIEPEVANREELRRQDMLSACSGPLQAEEPVLRMLSAIVYADDAQTTRRNVVEAVVKGTLMESPLSKAKLIERVGAALPGLAQKHVTELNSIVEELYRKGEIVLSSAASADLQLVPSLRNALSRRATKQLAVAGSLYEHHGMSSRGISQSKFSDSMENILRETVRRDAFILAEHILGNKPVTEPDTRSRVVALVEESVLSCDLDKAVDWTRIAIEILLNPDRAVQAWIAERYKAYFVLVSLNLDPECTRYQTALLSNYKVFLDSHIALRAVAGAGSGEDICREIVADGKRRKLRMYLIPPLLQEIDNSIRDANKHFLESGGDVERVTRLYQELGYSSDIFDGYIKKRKRNPLLSWESYLRPFWSVIEPNMLRDYLSHELGVGVEELPANYLKDDSQHIGMVHELLLELRGQTPVPGIKGEAEFGRDFHNIRLRQAEAVQVALVYEDRLSSGGSGEVWFVTFDEYVYRANARLANDDQYFRRPCYFPPARWLEFTRMLAKEPVAETTFREVYRSETLRRMAGALDTQVVTTVLARRIDRNIKGVQILRNLVKQAIHRPMVQQLLAKYDKYVQDGDKNREIATLAKINDTLAVLLSEAERNVIAEQRSRDKAEKKSSYFKADAARLRSAMARRKRSRRKHKK
jgi:hypothetical protein